MKNKKSTIGLMLLMAGSLVLTNCTKNKTNTAPTPDTDLTTTSEAVNTQMILSDIQEIGGQVCEANAFLLPYHDATPVTIQSGTNTISSNNAVITTGTNKYTVTFNNTVGRDGHIRNGVLVFDYSATPVTVPNPYYRIPGTIIDVTSTGYAIDGYTVQINNMRLKNTTPIGFPGTSPFFPAAYSMTWEQNANISVVSTNGSGTVATTFSGILNKKLLNTNNTSIPMPPGNSPTTYTVFGYSGVNNNFLKLQYQYVEYSGTGSGTLKDGSSYSFAINSPISRNMVSSPEIYASFNGALISTERHPFLTGTATFKPGSKNERLINFGASGDVVDYNAKVTIEGITYDLDMK